MTQIHLRRLKLLSPPFSQLSVTHKHTAATQTSTTTDESRRSQGPDTFSLFGKSGNSGTFASGLRRGWSGRADCRFLQNKFPFVKLKLCPPSDGLFANLVPLDLQPQQLSQASKIWMLDSLSLNFDLYSSSAAPPTPGASVSGQMAADGGICAG